MNVADLFPTIAGVLLVLVAAGIVLAPLARRGSTESLDAAEADRTELRFRLYRQVLDLELDRDTGKLSTQDFQVLSTELLQQAVLLLEEHQPDDADLEAAVEREIAAARAAFQSLRRAHAAAPQGAA